ncbi:TRAM domain-containing protein [Halalkalicoccus subterraneus]|uniref:TRAM domain-containing protein n=1 Tax=Halalkalicoccus subterraneus TaxID=2675002 RepID=UPI000EFCFFEB|nr:TRAM domain-containing protein [Halalkalicoccus subterraneus]
MPDCPLADECPSYSERIAGMGCQHYGDRGGAEWCNHYNQPIRELKQQPVQPGEEVVIEVDDMHESGAGVGRTEDGFIVMVDGILPVARARVKITTVRSNHARAEEIERLPLESEENEDEDAVDEEGQESSDDEGNEGNGEDEEGTTKPTRERLGSRDNFWGA